MKQMLLGLLIFNVLAVFSQSSPEFNTTDSRYFEDQMYLGLTYNFLRDIPEDITQRNLSYGLQGGIIKDIPLNSDRTFAIGIGLGYAVNSYYSNMIASESTNGLVYQRAADAIGLKRSKFETHLIELPFEIRWRDSTADEYKFWRVYAGLKFGYIFGSRFKLVAQDVKYSFNNPDINEFQYGLMLNFGYNTFNIHIYYALNNLFDNEIVIGNENINAKPLRIGLIFYIL